MKNEEFAKLVEAELVRCCDLLLDKGKEYAEANPDRLDAFKHAAAFERVTPQRALFGMLTKHLISIQKMCDAPSAMSYSEEQWIEKITDSINYLLLLLGLVTEERDLAKILGVKENEEH